MALTHLSLFCEQEYGGNLNEAVNAHFSGTDIPVYYIHTLFFFSIFFLYFSFFFSPAFQNYKQLIIMSSIFFKLVLLLCFMVQCISTTSSRPTSKFYCWQQWESSWTRTFSLALCCKKLQAFIAIWPQLQERHYKPYWCCWICWSIINTITSRSSYGPSYWAQQQAWAALSFSAEA